MTIIVFLIDTSASMFQRTYVGGRTTLLDVAKSSVETFVKLRQRVHESRYDRYMLLTFEEPPNNVKAGWKENLATFMNELKNLQSYSMTTMGVAVKQAFDILNINRMISGIDTYGQGRCPFFLETSVIVLITDGGKLSTINGVQEEFNLPMNSPIPGSELTREPFRWDQRLFALVLRLAGTPAIERDSGLVPSDASPIDAMCEVTGGRSYCITSHRMLNQCIDSLVQKVQNGVVINFEKIGPDPPLPSEIKMEVENSKDELVGSKDDSDSNPMVDRGSVSLVQNTAWYNCRRMIYVPRQQKGYPLGFWPIPESFWPEVTASVLPPRTAHPNVKFTCTSSDPMVIENLPFDKYELEPSPLTQYILARKQPTICWQVFVANSGKNSEVGHPFGYLKASTNLNCVNLFVMPYNYPVLLPLLDELFKVHRWKPTNEWRTQFQNYMRTLPAYYQGPLRRALTRMGTPLALAQTLIPDTPETSLSYSVSSYLKRLKNQAKVEYDRICNEILQRLANPKQHNMNMPEQIRVLPKINLKKDLISHPLLIDKFANQKDQIEPYSGAFTAMIDKERQLVSFRNPFDIPRSRLMQQVARMRNNFFQSDWLMQDLDSVHSLPISQMGNYQEYLKRQTPQLREIESAPVRQHMFGNPFKIDKRMMVDEADFDLVGSGAPGTNRITKRVNSSIDAVARMPSKRKPGPLPRDFIFRRPSSDISLPESPTSQPEPSPTPVPWLNSIEREIPSFDEKPTMIVLNGFDTPTSERSRSPSPTLELPAYNTPEPSRVLPSLNFNTNSLELNNTSSLTLNDSSYSLPTFTSVDSQISQILKEANSISPNVSNINNVTTNNINDTKSALNKHPVKPTPTIKSSQLPFKATVRSIENSKEVECQNLEVRKTLNRLVRKPGKNFTELFENIKTLKGDVDVQVEILRLVIKESLRFKRQHLANLIEDHIRLLQSTENKTC